ncbi:PfkB family carbohydrate kinase [Aestuariimicrobium ganziense]|uniref:PfkB family carbohydrate kinase n=1 Tax=Aestuariimicrobium ganziense TaxID=2773677 RepID=UPI001F378646|nr:PfkB family carbohydrate kinase [Aestuariimicrobium ganziense]
MTRGGRGALVACDGRIGEVVSPQVDVVDSTGAGDAFAGALAVRLVEGDDLVTAAGFAARVGAFACTGLGAQPS